MNNNRTLTRELEGDIRQDINKDETKKIEDR